MPQWQLKAVLQQLRKTMRRQLAGGLSDSDLLARFVQERDEAAFEVLVWRHGPLVLSLGLRLLHNSHDAEDVLQATFLTLVKRAGSIGKGASLASWLYKVAYHIALRVKESTRKRRASTTPVEDLPAGMPVGDAAGAERRLLLDEAIEELPEKYRTAVVLFYLQGGSQKEISEKLGCPVGTISTRLARAREMLAKRLARHGVPLSAGLLAAALTDHAVSAAVCPCLALSTAKAATSIVAGQGGAGVVSSQVARLTEGALNAMFAAKLKLGAVLFLALGALVGGVGLAAHHALTASPPAAEQAGSTSKNTKDAVAPDEKPARRDWLGDPLPGRAVARIGTTRWWCGRPAQECPPVFTPDGKTFACCDGKCVRFLNVTTGKELNRIAFQDEEIRRFVVSPDGKTAVTADWCSPVLRVWNVVTGKMLRQVPGDKDGSFALAFAPDGKTFAAAGDNIRLWDTSTWQEQRRFAADQQVSSLFFLPDERTLITGGGQARTIRWWDLKSGREIRRLEKRLSHSRLLALSPNRKCLAGVVEGLLFLWDATTGQEIRRTVLESDAGIYHVICFSPDGQTLACSYTQARRIDGAPRQQRLILFDVDTGREVRQWDQERGAESITYSPDGKTLAQTTSYFVHLREAKTGKPIQGWPGLPQEVLCVLFSPDAKRLSASCFGGPIASWDPLTGRQLSPFQGPPATAKLAGRDMMLLAAVLTADGNKAALVDAKHVLHVWEAATGKSLCRIDDPPVGSDQVDFSPDGNLLIVKHEDHFIRLWDAASGKLLHALPLAKGTTGHWFPHAHAFSSDGRLVATAPMSDQDRTMRVWETATGKEVRRFSWPDGTRPTCLAFSPDRKCLIAAHGGFGPTAQHIAPEDISLRLWDLGTGLERQRFKASAADIRALTFTPDGKTLAAGEGSTISLWEVVSGKERGHFQGHRDWVFSLAFSPDGRLLASGCCDHTALVWDLTGICPDGKWRSRDLRQDSRERFWADLAATDGPRAFAAVWDLAASADQAVLLLAARLKPAPAVESKRLDSLIAQLDNKSFSTRQQATRELENLGDLAEDSLKTALAKQPSLETQQRLEQILGKLNGLVTSHETLRALRGVEVLEYIGTPEARRVLQTLAEGARGARLTEEAKFSLERLTKRPAGFIFRKRKMD